MKTAEQLAKELQPILPAGWTAYRVICSREIVVVKKEDDAAPSMGVVSCLIQDNFVGLKASASDSRTIVLTIIA